MRSFDRRRRPALLDRHRSRPATVREACPAGSRRSSPATGRRDGARDRCGRHV